jgi:hypothetical protein
MKTKGEIDGSVNDDNAKKALSSPSDNSSLENVLVLQGGGSLGAFSCGVFKALVNNKVKIDIALHFSTLTDFVYIEPPAESKTTSS